MSIIMHKQSSIYILGCAAIVATGFLMYRRKRRSDVDSLFPTSQHEDEETLQMLQPMFEKAAMMAKTFPTTNETNAVMSQRDRLMLYGLYKQAKAGDCSLSPPSRLQVVEYAKYDAWMKFKGMPQKFAIMQYVEVVQHFANSFENKASGSDVGTNDNQKSTTFGLVDNDVEDIVYDESDQDEDWDESSDDEVEHKEQNQFMDNPIGIAKQSTLMNSVHDSASSDVKEYTLDDVAVTPNESMTSNKSILEAAMDGDIDTLQRIFDGSSHNCGDMDINEADEMGQTPLHYACDRCYLSCVSKLIHHGANINATDSDGISVLQTAVISGNVDIVKILLESGADPNLEDMDGESARSCALEDGCEELVKLFS